MSRIRTLKPTRFTSRSLAKCPRDARTTFEGMWCEADDHGRGIADARLLKGAIWPLDDDITFLHVSAFIDVLAATGHIRLYAVDGEAYYEVTNWEKHQAAAYRRGEAKYPPFSAGQPLESLDAHESVQESAAGTQMGAGTGNREQGTGNRDSTAASPAVSGDATIFDETPLADLVDAEVEETSKEVAVPDEITAGTIVAALIDQCRARNIDLPDTIIKRFGKQIKEHLPKHGHDVIWRAIVLMSHENVLDAPELLAKKIVAVQSGPRKFPTTVRTSATDEAVAGWLAMADQFPEGVAA
jgi:hypothetical protein